MALRRQNENQRVLQELATSISEAEARIDMLAREKGVISRAGVARSRRTLIQSKHGRDGRRAASVEGLAAELQQAQAARAAADKDAADAAAAHAKAVAAAEQGTIAAWRLRPRGPSSPELTVYPLGMISWAPAGPAAHKADLEAQRERHAGELAQLQGQLRAAQDELEKVRCPAERLAH